MTRQELEESAKRYQINSGTDLPATHWLTGAEFVNEKQPYTAEDMKLFYLWMRMKGDAIRFNPQTYNFVYWPFGIATEIKCEDLIKLWEESKNG